MSTKFIGSDFAGFDNVANLDLWMFSDPKWFPRAVESTPASIELNYYYVFGHTWFDAHRLVCTYLNADKMNKCTNITNMSEDAQFALRNNFFLQKRSESDIVKFWIEKTVSIEELRRGEGIVLAALKNHPTSKSNGEV